VTTVPAQRQTQLLVIGGGPGGYVAAIRAAQLGLKPFLVEKESLGGLCLNHGCIPSKALIHASDLYERTREASEVGIQARVDGMDGAKLQAWKNSVVVTLRQGIEQLFRQHKIEWERGAARFVDSRTARVTPASGEPYSVDFEKAVIATGTKPAELPNVRFDGQWVISSREALDLAQIPKDMVIVGGGYIGMELGAHFAKLGTKLTIVEYNPTILSGSDPDAVALVRNRFEQMGVRLLTSVQAQGFEPRGKRAVLTAKQRERNEVYELECDKILVAVGLRPNLGDLGLEGTRVKLTDKGFVQVDAQRRTTDPNIYAVGDVTGNPMLAHKAFYEGRVAAESIAGRAAAYDPKAVPGVVFTDPEIAHVGLQEHEAKAQGIAVKVGAFPLRASGRAWTRADTYGFVKVIASVPDNRVRGVLVVGPEAGETISEAALALEMGATVEDLALTIHPHPTLPEALGEAAEDVLGKAIHFYRPPAPKP
jgi:dihydrolipoamide dehydrogenase